MINWMKKAAVILGAVSMVAACSSSSGSRTGTTGTGEDASATDGGTDNSDGGTDTTDGGTDTTDGGTDTTDGGTDTTDGADGTDGGTGMMGDGACANTEDQAILTNEDDDIDITTEAQNCGFACLGDADAAACAGACVEEATGLTLDCATCFGALLGCTIEFCVTPCAADPSSAECDECRAENCNPAFEMCSGEDT